MATSSITKNFVISGKEQVEAFIELLDKGPVPIRQSSSELLTDKRKIQDLISAAYRKRDNVNG